MNTSNVINFGIFLATVMAATIAWVGTIRACKSADEANRIQAAMLQLEQERELRSRLAEQKALFSFEPMYIVPKECMRLYFKNIGNGRARGIEFFGNTRNIMHWQNLKFAQLGENRCQ